MATIYFDLDGTLYDLYNQPNWLERITTKQDATAYANDEACLVDIQALHALLDELLAKGYNIGVITWLAKDATKTFNTEVRKVKKAWIKKFLPHATEVHVVKFGTSKQAVAKDDLAVIVDDNDTILKKWTKGLAIDAKKDILKQLSFLL